MIGTGRRRNARMLLAMARAGLTGRALADQAGVSSVTVSALLCRRRTARPATAVKLAAVLGVPADELQLVEGAGQEVRHG